MTVTGAVIKNIIRKLIAGQDYRSEVVTLIDAEFLPLFPPRAPYALAWG